MAKQMTLKEYLQQSDPANAIPSYLFNCGQLIDLLDERDELREQLEAVAKAEPLLEDEEEKIVAWLDPAVFEVMVDGEKVELPAHLEFEDGTTFDVRTYISGGEVMERKV